MVINLVDNEKEMAIRPIWRQAFRPLFLFGSVFSSIALACWALFLSGKLSFQPYGGAFFWHGHEMLFGFVVAIVIGFLLTAVQNWTGLRATHGLALKILFTLWLCARILLFAGIEQLKWLAAITDIGFLLLAAVFMAQLVVKAGNTRNLFFVPILIILAASNAVTHYSVLFQQPAYFQWGMHSAILLITLMMVLIAGRVFPMFTANGTGTEKVLPLVWLEKSVIGTSALTAILFITKLEALMPPFLMAAFLALSVVLHLLRAIRWRPWVTTKTPLVWSLHCAYWFIPLGYALLAASYMITDISISTALHALTAGAMSTMILAMISRVSLGHTGRPLVLPKTMAFAFLLMIIAGIVRVAAANFVSISPQHLWLISALLWILAIGTYIVRYFSILTSPRPDGRAG
eukprot:TRINITY_DN11079_c0_g1_i4.p1 TRINITY_DN11079_c0_g1~~TRINITY_DN11079_c0_g1_i4.p1  ORF type:complete len:403 (-),score=-18.03 TRINITY_DN11079_c0_g1_i4:342-1550(-)